MTTPAIRGSRGSSRQERTSTTEPAPTLTVIVPAHNESGRAAGDAGLARQQGPGAKLRLPHGATDLVLAVDADTVLAADYIEMIKPAFADPGRVAAACRPATPAPSGNAGRSVEYPFGFHWHRPIQHAANSLVVCSGCCSARRKWALPTMNFRCAAARMWGDRLA
jgi:N-acetylglucosaminyltransferase